MIEFKDVYCDSRYKVSNTGLVIRKSWTNKRGVIYPERIMPHSILSTGYPKVCLRGKVVTIHRIIAKAFIPNHENKPEVNHINGIKTDFRVSNLEWVTRSENQKHSWEKLGRIAKMAGKTGFKHHSSRAVNHYDIDGNLLNVFGSASFASKQLGFHHYSVEWAIKKKEGYYKGNVFTYAM